MRLGSNTGFLRPQFDKDAGLMLPLCHQGLTLALFLRCIKRAIGPAAPRHFTDCTVKLANLSVNVSNGMLLKLNHRANRGALDIHR